MRRLGLFTTRRGGGTPPPLVRGKVLSDLSQFWPQLDSGKSLAKPPDHSRADEDLVVWESRQRPECYLYMARLPSMCS